MQLLHNNSRRFHLKFTKKILCRTSLCDGAIRRMEIHVNYLASAVKQKATVPPRNFGAWSDTNPKKSSNAVAFNTAPPKQDRYSEAISLIERVHRNFLDVVKFEIDCLGIHDINTVQAVMLLNIGDAEMPVGELIVRGCYLGSNVSYNVKKMIENGYLAQERSVHDRRSIHVRLTKKGFELRDRLESMHQRHVEMLNETAITDADLTAATLTLRRLERFWSRKLVQRANRADADFAE